MNRNIFALIIGGIVIFLILSFNFYKNEKKNFFNEFNHYIQINKLIKQINAFKLQTNLKYFKKYHCKIIKNTTIKIKCNLSQTEFASFQNIFKLNYSFKSFNIVKNKNIISIDLELNQ